MHCAFIFSTPYSIVLTINVSTYALSIKKNFQLINPCLCKNDVSCRYVCCRKLGGGGGREQLLVCFASVFIHVCGMLCGTLCIMLEEVLKSKFTR